MKATSKKVNKKNYEVHQFISGYFGIIEKKTQDCVYGGDSACEDHYDEELMNTIFNNWDGSLEFDSNYGWQITNI